MVVLVGLVEVIGVVIEELDSDSSIVCVTFGNIGTSVVEIPGFSEPTVVITELGKLSISGAGGICVDIVVEVGNNSGLIVIARFSSNLCSILFVWFLNIIIPIINTIIKSIIRIINIYQYPEIFDTFSDGSLLILTCSGDVLFNKIVSTTGFATLPA